MGTIRRSLTLLDVFCLGLNAIIGSGIFIFPGILAALVGPASILAFLVCGVLLSLVALCYAELGAMFDGNGGSYLYAREAFGDRIGFGVGVVAWATAVLSWSAVASALAAQMGYFHPALEGSIARKTIAALGLICFGVVNYRGIKPGARSVDLLTLAKLIPLVAFIVLGIPSVETSRFLPLVSGDGRFAYAVFLALWTLQGFEVAPVPAGESTDPQRDVPRAVLGSLISAVLVYTVIQFVAVGAFPALAESSERPLTDAARAFAGSWAGGLLAVGAVISMLGFIAGAALGAPRYLSALGEHSLRPWRLDRSHPRFSTPHRAIVATTSGGVLLVLLVDTLRLIDLSNLAVVTQYFSACLSLCVLRVRRPSANRPYRVPLAWVVAPCGCMITVWLMTRVSLTEISAAALLLVLGYLLRYAVGEDPHTR